MIIFVLHVKDGVYESNIGGGNNCSNDGNNDVDNCKVATIQVTGRAM